jgi:hypothetical protein
MDIPFPSQLQWVTPLVGSHWPQGSESAWWRTAGYLHDHAAALEAQIPDLTKVRSKTHAVLVGETAQAFEQQSGQLFSGDTAVDKKVAALRSLGDAAESLGSEIQYTKLSIYSMLVIAAGSILFALANSEWTLGASLAQIPVIRWLTENAMARLVSMVLGRIEAELAARLGSMLVARLVVEGMVSAGIGAAQEGGIEAIQVAEGRRDGIDVGTVLHSALSMGLAGMAGGLAGHEVGGLVGAEGSTALRALKGAVTGLASAEAANVAGTLAGGGHVGADTFLGGAIGLVHGGLGGASAHGAPAQDPTETPMPANAIDTHPTLRLEKQPDGTFAWPGETANDAGSQAHTTSPTATAEPPAASSEPAASAPAGNGGSSAPDPAVATGDRAGLPSNGSPGAGDPGARSEEATTTTPPAAADDGHLPATSVTAGLDAAPTAHASVGAHLPEGTLDRAITSSAASTGPIAATGPPSLAPSVPSAAGSPSPAPTSAPASPGPNTGLSSPAPDPHAAPAEISPPGESSSQPAGSPAAGRVDTTATPTEPGMHEPPAEQAAAAEAVGVDRAAPAGRSEASSHAVGREDTTATERQQRPAAPVTKRQDPSTRPNANRRDSGTGPRGLPGKLRSGVARDTGHLQPAAAARASDPLAAAEETGVITAHHDGDPGPGEPDSHEGGSGGSDGQSAPEPGAAGGGAGGAGGHSGGGAGDGGAGHDDGGGDDFARDQQEYRAQDRATRRVDARYADPLGEFLDDASGATRIEQVAKDLSGMYGSYRVKLSGEGDEDGVGLVGEILSGGEPIGDIELEFVHDIDGALIADFHVQVDDEYELVAAALSSELVPYCDRSGVARIKVFAVDGGGHPWLSLGFSWDLDPSLLSEWLDMVKDSAEGLRDRVGPEVRMVLDDIVARLDPLHPLMPEPTDLANVLTNLAAPGVPDLGRQLLAGINVDVVKDLRGGADEPHVPSWGDAGPGGDAGGAGDVRGFGSSGVGGIDRGAGPGGAEPHEGPLARGDDSNGDYSPGRSPGTADTGGAGGHSGDGGAGDGGAGHGDAGGDDFLRQQRVYRAQDLTTRRVDTRYAEPLNNVWRNPARADQLAKDLSGIYGPCRIAMTQEHWDPPDVGEQIEAMSDAVPVFGPSIYGEVLSGDQVVGTIHWWFDRQKLGVLVVRHRLFVDTDFSVGEFCNAVAVEMEPYLQSSGAVRIESETYGRAAYAAAARGESWNPDQNLMQESLVEIKRSASELSARVSDEGRRVLADIVQRLDPNHARLPEPEDLADLATPAEPDLGQRLLEGTGVHNPNWDEIRPETLLKFVRYLQWNPQGGSY